MESDIPLLLSKDSLKRAGEKLDLENVKAVTFGKEVAWNLTTAGHYRVPIDRTDTIPVVEVNTVQETSQRRAAHTPKAVRPPSKKRLIALLKNANVWKEEYLETLSELEQNCDICISCIQRCCQILLFLFLASEFNEKVAMDLKKWYYRCILHIYRYVVSLQFQFSLREKHPVKWSML